MLFHSLEFALFLPAVFGIYWFVLGRSRRAQNFLLFVASYVFYGWWDYRFLSLLAFSTAVDFISARKIEASEDVTVRRAWLGVSMLVNLGMLGVFKYYDFFASSLAEGLHGLGVEADPFLLRVILPVGISFYSFQTLSYTIDVYRRDLRAADDIIAFATFVAFFPQLVAGPIERATNLFPQFLVEREFSSQEASLATREILWGLFKKVVIADTCAAKADYIFANHQELSSPTLALGAVYFSVQIYADFSAYSDIAVGSARLLGFRLMRNFIFPYFSRDIAEFWRRWHISLSTWFRDYVYIPLGGSRGPKGEQIRNVLIVFMLSGLWHGANWTFLIWGALNGLYFLPLLLRKQNRRYLDGVAPDKLIPSLGDAYRISFTFAATCFAWIFFRAETVGHAWRYVIRMVSPEAWGKAVAIGAIPAVLTLIAIDWLTRRDGFAVSVGRLRTPVRWAGYVAMAVVTIGFMHQGQSQFIYFQF